MRRVLVWIRSAIATLDWMTSAAVQFFVSVENGKYIHQYLMELCPHACTSNSSSPLWDYLRWLNWWLIITTCNLWSDSLDFTEWRDALDSSDAASCWGSGSKLLILVLLCWVLAFYCLSTASPDEKNAWQICTALTSNVQYLAASLLTPAAVPYIVCPSVLRFPG